MNVPGQADLRANQKARTRAALVEAAKRLLQKGTPPSVAEAADEAKVSRATAYRYFPTQDELLLEISSLGPAVEPVERVVDALEGDDPRARLLRLVDTFNPVAFEEEAAVRTGLRTYLDTWLNGRAQGQQAPTVREGRRMRWLDVALEPARPQLTDRQWRRLRAALALTLGGDAMVVMKDVCHLKDAEALAVLRWAAVSLLDAALEDARSGGKKEPTRATPARGRRKAGGSA